MLRDVPNSRVRRLAAGVWCGFWVAAACGLTCGAEPAAAPAAAPPPAVAAPEITPESLKARLEQVDKVAGLEEEQKKKVVELYQAAVQHLRAVQAWSAKAQQFDAASGLLEAVKKQLAETPPAPESDLPADASVDAVSQRLAACQAKVAESQKRLGELDAEVRDRSKRRAEVPKLLADAKKRAEQAEGQLGAKPTEGEPAEMTSANRAMLLALKRALDAQIEACSKELATYDLRGALVSAQRDLVLRELSGRQKLAQALQADLAKRRKAEAAKGARQAKQAQREAASAHPVLRRLAEENAELAQSRAGSDSLAPKIKWASDRLAALKKARDKLADDLDGFKKRESMGLGDTIPLVLRKKRRELPDVRDLRSRIRHRTSEIAQVHLRCIELEEQRLAHGDIEGQVKTALAGLPAGERERLDPEVRELLTAKRGYLDALAGDYDSYFARLVDLSDAEERLITLARECAQYIDERILWTPSASSVGFSVVPKSWEAGFWLLSGRGWFRLARSLWGDTCANIGLYGAAILVLILLVLVRLRLPGALQAIARLTESPETDSMLHSVLAFAWTGLASLPGPAVLGFLAWRLARASDGAELQDSVAAGLEAAAWTFLVLEFLRTLSLRRGLGEAHFKWHAKGLALLRRRLTWLMAVSLPMVFLCSAIDWQSQEARKDSLGRLAFIVYMVTFTVFVQRVLRPSGAIIQDAIDRNRGGWIDRLRGLWYGLAVLSPAALVVLAVFGYYYTAHQLMRRVQATAVLILGLAVACAFLVRWVLVIRHRIAARDRRERKDADQADVGPDGEPGTETVRRGDTEEDPDEILDALGHQARRLMRSLQGFVLLIGVWLIWSDVLPALGALRRVVLWSSATQPVTLADLVLALLIVMMTLIAGRHVPGVLETVVWRRLPLSPGARYAITAISNYTITIVGMVIAFGTIGLGWSQVQWLAAAVTVGLGFGLQEIFANFVCGLIILFERPIRVGDTVTVGDVTGTVTQIRIRATTITDWDRKELIVPNKGFITGQLVNWSLSDPIFRALFPVGIAYGSDTALAHEVLLKVARECVTVLDDPPPTVLFKGFGDSCLDFELRAFIPGIESYVKAWDQVNTAIDQEFRKAGIVIAFPQRDLHLCSVQAPVPVIVKPN